ncbi:MAG: 50S ribosomal protein L20 [Candidatus Paceibacterota bacterium]
MPRVKRGKTKTKKRESILKQTKGFKWHRKKKKRSAKEALIKAWSNAFKGRKNKKRNFRKLWNIKINAAARQNGTKYSELIDLMKKNKVDLDRKVLADLAEHEPEAFSAVVDKVKGETKTKKEEVKV